MKVRPYRPSDRREVLELLNDARPLDALEQRVQVAKDGERLDGVATWTKPDDGDEGYLGAVILRDPGDTRLFHELIGACVQQAVDEGVERGYATTRERGVVRHLTETFGLEAEPAGWDPHTKKPVEWKFHVELRPFLDQLRAVA